jgi:hypothetical protein
MFEKIYLHTGLPKTGTSFLQNALDALSRRNALVQTSYPVLNDNEDLIRIQSGSGESIAFQLLAKLVPDFSTEAVSRLTQQLFDAADASKPHLLISSEHFSTAEPDRLAYFIELLKVRALSVEIISFVRPVDQLCQSRYHQQVKRHSKSEDYNEEYFESFCNRLVTQLSLIGNATDTVHTFGYTRTGLLGLLLSFLGENPALQDAFSDQLVNRSLTASEMEILRTINGVFKNDELSTRISDRWIYANPEAMSCEAGADRARVYEVLRKVAAAHAVQLVTPACQEMLKGLLRVDSDQVGGDGLSAEERGNSPEFPANERVQLLHLALEEIAAFTSSGQALANYAKSLTPTRDTFDPIHYLLLNRDVLAAAIDPVLHFKTFGRKEGRYSALSSVSALFD